MIPVPVPWTAATSLAFMVSLANEAGQTRAAENYLLELMAACAFTDPANRPTPS